MSFSSKTTLNTLKDPEKQSVHDDDQHSPQLNDIEGRSNASEKPEELEELTYHGLDAVNKPIYRRFNGDRVINLAIREPTTWEVIKVYVTFPLMLWRIFKYVAESGDPSLKDPTVIAFTGKLRFRIKDATGTLPSEGTRKGPKTAGEDE